MGSYIVGSQSVEPPMAKQSPSYQTPPGPRGLPLLGNTHQFLRRNPLDWFSALESQYGDVVQVKIVGQRVILPTNPQDVEHVLVTNNRNYLKGGFQKLVTRSLLGNGLVLAEGDEWRSHRREMEPAFHPDRMPQYGQVIRTHIDRVVERWSPGDVVDLEREMKQLTLNIIVDALFGIDLADDSWGLEPAFNRILAHYERISQTYLYVPERLPTPENRAYRRALGTLDAAVEKIITSYRRGNIQRPTVLDQLVEGETELSDKEIRDEIVTLLVAGHETTALMLTFTGYLLGRHTDVAERVAQEARADSEIPLMKRVEKTPVLDRVLKESLRLYPPVFGIFREPIDDDVLGGYRVPSGSIVALNQWVAHRNEEVFENPNSFHPERWTEQFEAELPAGAYFPFAAGPRRCIGERFAMMEAKMILTQLLASYDFTLVSKTELEVAPSLTTQPKDPVQVRLNSSNNS